MFWEDIEPIVTPELTDAVAKAYDVFGRYRLSGTIVHCDCPVCMTAETAAALVSRPLREISAGLLAEYTNSAHGYDREIIEPQFKYFLPRYFDLIANCDMPCSIGAETCLTRLQGYREAEAWPPAEVDAVDRFFDAFVAVSVHQLQLLEWPVGFRLEYDMGEVLGMVILAGGDLDRVLAVFDRGPDPDAAIHMASMRLDVNLRRDGPYFENAHYDNHPDAARRVGAWLQRDSVSERIFSAHEKLQDSDYEELLSLGF